LVAGAEFTAHNVAASRRTPSCNFCHIHLCRLCEYVPAWIDIAKIERANARRPVWFDGLAKSLDYLCKRARRRRKREKNPPSGMIGIFAAEADFGQRVCGTIASRLKLCTARFCNGVTGASEARECGAHNAEGEM
jgi:hypothetical protein